MIYLVYEQELTLYGSSSVIHWVRKKEVVLQKGSHEGLIILYFEFES
jgi:hypothetical protein